jgi:hypothetical protein
VLPDTQYYTRDAPTPTSHPSRRPGLLPGPDPLGHGPPRTTVTSSACSGSATSSIIPTRTPSGSAPARRSAILEDDSDPAWPHGLPFGVAFGNHDQFPKDEPEATDVANSYFGVDRFAGRPYYGGNFDGDNDENFVVFPGGGLQIVVVSFQFNPSPSDEVLAWARGVFESHPRARRGRHPLHRHRRRQFQRPGRRRSTRRSRTSRTSSSWPPATSPRTRAAPTNSTGNVIHSMLSDYQRSAPKPSNPEEPEVVEQGLTNGGHGYMRIWNFIALAQQAVFVETYSPKKDASYTDDRNEFDLERRPRRRRPGPFTSLGVVASPTTAPPASPSPASLARAPPTSGTPSPATAPTPPPSPCSRCSCSATRERATGDAGRPRIKP